MKWYWNREKMINMYLVMDDTVVNWAVMILKEA